MPTVVSKLVKAIEDLKRRGVSILLVEQKVPLALDLSDRVYIMEGGLIRYCGGPEELREREELLLSYLGVKLSSR